MILTQHFTLAELTKSETAIRKGIVNTPDEQAITNLTLVCNIILEPVREHYGIPFSPNSGFRCLELNRAIGSSDNSQHVEGKAVDFEVPGIDNKDVALWVKKNCAFDQIILEFYKEGQPSSGWVHCSYDFQKDPQRKSAKVFDGTSWSEL
jgi:zinc D-Ala-D-Ala carboxypeptidase